MQFLCVLSVWPLLELGMCYLCNAMPQGKYVCSDGYVSSSARVVARVCLGQLGRSNAVRIWIPNQKLEIIWVHLMTVIGKLRGEDCEDRLKINLSEEDCDHFLVTSCHYAHMTGAITFMSASTPTVPYEYTGLRAYGTLCLCRLLHKDPRVRGSPLTFNFFWSDMG